MQDHTLTLLPLAMVLAIAVILLMVRLRQVREQTDGLLNRLREQDDALSNKQQEIVSSLAMNESLEDQFQVKAQDLQAEIHDKQVLLEEKIKALEQAQEALKESEARLTENEGTIASLKAELAKLTQDIAERQGGGEENEVIRAELEQWRLRCESSEEELNSAQALVEAAKTRLTIKEKETANFQEALHRRDAKIAALSEELERVDKAVQEHDAALKEREYLLHHWQQRYNKVAQVANQHSKTTKDYLKLAQDWKDFADKREIVVARQTEELERLRSDWNNERMAYRARNRELARQRDDILVKLNDADKALASMERNGPPEAPSRDAPQQMSGPLWEQPFPAAAAPFVPVDERKAVVISLVNPDGRANGVSLAADLGAALAERGAQVLMIDLDRSRSLTKRFFSLEDRHEDLARFRTEGRHVQRFLAEASTNGDALNECIVAPVEQQPNLSMIVCAGDDLPRVEGPSVDLEDVEAQVLMDWLTRNRETDARLLLRSALHAESARDRFDFVLIDCPSQLSLAPINALAASDLVLPEIVTDHVAVTALLRKYRRLKDKSVSPHLQVLGVVATSVTSDDSLSELGEKCAEAWGDAVPFCAATVAGDAAADGETSALSDLIRAIHTAVGREREESEPVVEEPNEIVESP